MIKSVFPPIRFFGKWTFIVLLISLSIGSTSALFLWLLNQVTTVREQNLWVLIFLPIAGLGIVWWYQRYGGKAQKGNNLLLKEYYHPDDGIPWKMAPMIILTTLATHLFGGSAGREGTAVQYGATLADQIHKIIRLTKKERRVLLLCGIAAGFSSLFGTPLAGALFALEMVQLGRVRWRGMVPVVSSALLANWTCSLYADLHTTYPPLTVFPAWSTQTIVYLALAGLAFGLAAQLFSRTGDLLGHLFKKIKQVLLRPIIGGTLVVGIVFLLQSSRHIGLGIPTILASFEQPLPFYDFFIKIILTTLTLGSGFKGGEVTPLFFIGATLGNALAAVIPLPIALLATTGFVSVFAGCTKTPIACTVMAMELFGWHGGLFFLITCTVSLLISGKYGIYSIQKKRLPGRFIKRIFRS
ncbi:chloride channel protein [Sphingobacterium suaedae]|uniref:Chloride channel protein n=1 Tax=Sphingobacterium suaedae TaxID=1686402 RepID=A0ABW5KG20_9SPHI